MLNNPGRCHVPIHGETTGRVVAQVVALGYLCALAQEVRNDATLDNKTSSGFATPVGSRASHPATLRPRVFEGCGEQPRIVKSPCEQLPRPFAKPSGTCHPNYFSSDCRDSSGVPPDPPLRSNGYCWRVMHTPEQLFHPLAATILAFAKERGLVVERYYHESPTWTLGFGHPNGGQAKLDITCNDDDTIQLQSFWWIDNYKQFTRSLRDGVFRVIARDAEQLSVTLDECFKEVLSWEIDQWSKLVSDFKPYWSSISEDVFERSSNRWPRLLVQNNLNFKSD